jgi:hypothetical protein|tara:strand:- start:3446 stop:4909 length:1464 start_codon:yes stop_codon:yes gene_type:complete
MAITAGGSLNSIPNPTQNALSSNFIDFTASGNGWAQQYLPDLMEKEAEVFGNRTVSGFLSQVGAEEAMTADQVVWSEQGRLHLAYTGTIDASASAVTLTGHAGTNATYTTNEHGLRVGDTCIVASPTVTYVGRVTADDGSDVIIILPYTQGHASEAGIGMGDEAVTVLKYGSEWAKGADTPYSSANEPSHQSFTNKPVIIRDMYHVSGSDSSAIGWVEVTGEDGGAGGYLWYLKAEGETRMRFTDNLEMTCLEGVMGANDTTLDTQTNGGALFTGGGTNFGTQGLFDAIKTRGNATSGISGVNAATDLAEFDAILAEFDAQGAIEENMMFVNRATALAIDDMLASMNSYGAGGTSYGVFDNDQDMALNLGFSGFRRGSYDFYKSDWKYLNDAGTRGAINARATSDAIRGVIVPAGVSSVYDQQLGKNMKRPFLHVRYRASQTDNRRLKTWVTGSVGAATSELDAMRINYLSERCLITQGANNFMLMQ